MFKEFDSLVEMEKIFNTEEKCIKHLVKLRWNNKPTCLICGGTEKVCKIRTGLYNCYSCNRNFSVKVGTIFEDSKLPMKKWFMAFYFEVSAHKKGISSCQLAKNLQVQQKTAWFVLQRIRYAIANNTIEKPTNLKGNVEIDETYIGGKESNMHKDKKPEIQNTTKAVIVGMVERKGRAVLEYITKSNIKHIKPVLERHIDFDNSQLYTDTSPLYKGHTERKTVNHTNGEYVNGDIYTNTIENVFSQFKRSLHGIHHQVARKHLQKYINTFAFRFNNRKLNTSTRFNMALNLMFGKKLTYKTLIG